MDYTFRIRKFITRSVTFSKMPDFLKIFLFGVDGTTGCAYERYLRMNNKPVPETASRRKRIDYGQIDCLVKQWMEDVDNVLRDFTIGDMADDIGVNYRTLSRYFSIYLGQDFRVWKNTLKIRKAMDLIIDCPDCELSEIAVAVGFPDKSNFYRQFKVIAGCTPGVWKNTGGHPELERSKSGGSCSDVTGAQD